MPVTIGRAGRHKERPAIELTVVEVGAQQVGEVGHRAEALPVEVLFRQQGV